MAQTEATRGIELRLRAGALAFVLAALMTLPAVFTVHLGVQGQVGGNDRAGQ